MRRCALEQITEKRDGAGELVREFGYGTFYESLAGLRSTDIAASAGLRPDCAVDPSNWARGRARK